MFDGEGEETFISHLKLVANADEAKFARLVFRILCTVGVFKQLSNKFVFGLAHEAFQRHVEGVVVLLHKPSLWTQAQRADVVSRGHHSESVSYRAYCTCIKPK